MLDILCQVTGPNYHAIMNNEGNKIKIDLRKVVISKEFIHMLNETVSTILVVYNIWHIPTIKYIFTLMEINLHSS